MTNDPEWKTIASEEWVLERLNEIRRRGAICFLAIPFGFYLLWLLLTWYAGR